MKNFIKLGLVVISLVCFSCKEDGLMLDSCIVNVANSSITITSNISGEEGTQITPDDINQSSITTNSAEISFKVHKVGECHEVVDYGHVWSLEFATPTVENANQSNYGSNVNFGDEVKTLMNNLSPNRKYYVRGYVKVRGLEDNSTKTLYNDNISSFTTIKECDAGDEMILDDSDRQTVFGTDNNFSILSFEIVRERIAECDDGVFVAVGGPQKKFTYIKNLISEKISCEYEIKYKLFSSDGSLFTEWDYNGVLNNLNPNDEIKVYLTDTYGNIHMGVIEVILSNITYG